jgi:molecular chaperone GrpE (heat shock protein)
MTGPPASPEEAQIATCLCLRREIDRLSANLAASRQSYDRTQAELRQLDNQLQQERGTMDVNNPASVSRYRQLLDRRDTLFRQAKGPEFAAFSSSTERYNAAVNDFNARCSGRPQNADVLARVQSSLTCP